MAERPTPEERRFRALAGSSLDHVAEIDGRGRIVYVSPDARPGRDADSLGFERIHPEDRRVTAETLAEALRTGESQRTSFRVVDPERPGQWLWLEVTMTPFVAEDDARHALLVSRDVTGSRRLEERLRETRERFRRVAENAYDMIAEYDASGALLYCNDRVWEVLGYPETDRVREPGHLVHRDDRETLIEAFERVRDGVEDAIRIEHRVQRFDGSWCWVESTVCASEEHGGPRNPLIISRDITERMIVGQRLRESERRYRDLIEKAPVGIAVVQGERVVFSNPAGAAMCGAKDVDELLGTDMLELLPADAMRDVVAAVDRARRGENPSDAFDVRIVGLDGRERHLLGVGSFSTWEGEPAFQAVMRDVTELEQSRRDRERLALQLQEARKLESLGVLAGGIAHDFNNLLAVVLSNVRYAKVPEASAEERSEALCDAEDATESAARLVRQLLAYAGRRKPEVRGVDVSELARSMSELLSTALPGAVDLRLETAAGALPVHADVVQLEQVLMNLVINAADAVGEGPGRVTVRTRLSTLDEETLAGWIGGERGPGAYAELEVEDTGAGMDDATRARIFEPFFTTKQEGHGLGLSAVLGLVQGHEGAICVESRPGRGTRFRVALPADLSRLPVAPERARPALVLVADPDARRIRATGIAIRDSGVETLEACDDDALLDLCARHGGELDAAVVDVRSAGGDAKRLLRTLRGRHPELPILALLGPMESGEALDPTLDAIALHAPFTLRGLCERLGALLEKRDDPA